MTKQEVLRDIDFGQSVAEQEIEQLKHYFVHTRQWNEVNNGDIDVIYGSKGVGKSAIYALMNEYEPDFFQKNILLKFAENPRGATAFSDLQIDPPASEREFINMWKLYLLVMIGNNLNELGIHSQNGKEVINALEASGLIEERGSLKALLGRVRNYISRYFYIDSFEPNASFDENSGMLTGVGCKITFNEPSFEHSKMGIQSVDSLIYKANEALSEAKFSIWFMLDRLDVAFSDSHELEENALKALFKTYLDLANCNRIKLKIFLRSDIWQRITKQGFREATHITRAATISWDRSSLLNLIVRRFLSNNSIREFYNVDAEGVLLSESEQEKLFYRIFPQQVDSGKNPDTLEWIIGRTKDATGNSAPRDIINLVKAAIIEQNRMYELGGEKPAEENLFTRSSLKKALTFASTEKIDKYLFAEFPQYREYFEKLKDGKSKNQLTYLSEIWSITPEETEKIADGIAETGFWTKERKDPPEYWIPFLFRDGLGITQGTAIIKSRH